MNCRVFEQNVADWVKGALPAEMAGAMEAHRSACRACAREEAMERQFRSAFQALPEPGRAPEIWPAVAAKLHQPAPASFWARWKPQTALAATLAAGVLCAVIYFQNGMPHPGHVQPQPMAANEPTVVQMVAEMRELPDFSRDRMEVGPPIYHLAGFGSGDRLEGAR